MTSSRYVERIYDPGEVITFRKTKEAFGGLSNMAGGYPLTINGVEIRTSEALYQACRYPHLPDVQRVLMEQKSPMTAKMKSKKYRKETRSDWEVVRVRVMRWCLHVKLLQHYESFGDLLASTGDKQIVELSTKDRFWGAVEKDGVLVGVNALGRLLMELREFSGKIETGEKYTLFPPKVERFLLMGDRIGPMEFVPKSGDRLGGRM